MRKLFIYLILVLCSIAQAPQEPMLGELPDASQFPMPVYLGPFNEGTGNKVYDLSGNNYIGTLVADTHWTPGKFGSALKFDGTGDIVALSKPAEADFTFIVWVYVTVDSSYNFIASHGYALNNGWDFCRYGATDVARIYCRDGTNTTSAENSTTLTLNTWYQVGFTYRASDYQTIVYVDGVGGTPTTTRDIAFPHNELLFGARGTQAGVSLPFTGLIDNAVLFNSVLTARQIAQLSIDPFPWFREEPSSLYVTAAAPTGGQVIFINFASMGYGFGGFGLILIIPVIRKLRRIK